MRLPQHIKLLNIIRLKWFKYQWQLQKIFVHNVVLIRYCTLVVILVGVRVFSLNITCNV